MLAVLCVCFLLPHRGEAASENNAVLSIHGKVEDHAGNPEGGAVIIPYLNGKPYLPHQAEKHAKPHKETATGTNGLFMAGPPGGVKANFTSWRAYWYEPAYARLIEMEGLAFAVVREGRLEEAREPLFSDNYRNRKDLYSAGEVIAASDGGSRRSDRVRRSAVRRVLSEHVGQSRAELSGIVRFG